MNHNKKLQVGRGLLDVEPGVSGSSHSSHYQADGCFARLWKDETTKATSDDFLKKPLSPSEESVNTLPYEDSRRVSW